MSERNGDRARFHKDRKRKMLRRQRAQALAVGLTQPTGPASGAGAQRATATLMDDVSGAAASDTRAGNERIDQPPKP